MSILDALSRGWYAGMSAWPEYIGGGFGLLEDLIPGKQEGLERQENILKDAAQRVRERGPAGESEGILEKIAEGLGAAPLDLTTYLPAGAVAGSLVKAGKLGKTIGAPALTFGLTSAIRGGGEGLARDVGHGIQGGIEGALFGAAGKWARGLGVTPAQQKLVDELSSAKIGGQEAAILAAKNRLKESGIDALGQQVKRKVAHGAAAGAIPAGMSLTHGGDWEDVGSAFGTMGILGLLGSGKYQQRGLQTDESLRAIAPEIREYAAERAEKLKTPPTKKELQEEAAFVPARKVGSELGNIRYDIPESQISPRPYDALTDASQVRYKPIQDDINAAVKSGETFSWTNKEIERAGRTLATDPEGNPQGGLSQLPAFVKVLGDRATARAKEVAELRQAKALAERDGKTFEVQELTDRIDRVDKLYQADLMDLHKIDNPISGAMRAIGLNKAGSPDWVAGVKFLEKKGLLEKDGSGRFRKDIEQMMQMSEGNPALQAKIAKALQAPTLFDKMQEYWINGLLSGPPTHAVNTLSNAYFLGLDMFEKKIATKGFMGIGGEVKHGYYGWEKDPTTGEKVRVKKDLTKEQAALENAADIKSFTNGVTNGLKVFWDILSSPEDAPLKPEFAKYEQYRRGQSKMDFRSRAISGKKGSVIRFPSKALEAMDIMFKVISGDRYGTAKALRMAYEDSQAGRIGNTRADIKAQADKYLGVNGEPHAKVLEAMQKNAKRLTYTEDPTGFAEKTISARDVTVDVPGIGPVRPLVGVLPFVNTPWNVIRQAVKRSPLGVLGLKKLKSQYERGEITANDYYREVAATTIGSTMTMAMIGMAKAGLITGGGPQNPQDRANKIATGWRPYSIKAGDTYWQIQRLEPFGTILGMAGDIAEYGDAEDKVGKLMATIKDNLTDKSFLYGLESLSKAWSNPEQFGGTYYKQMAGSLVPTVFAKAAQAIDPYSRQTEVGGAELGVPDAMAYRIPGMSRELPMRTTAFGEPQERWGVYGTDDTAEKVYSGLQSATIPFGLSKEREGVEVEKEFDRLRAYQGMPPSMPKRSKRLVLQGVHGEKVELKQEEYDVFTKYHKQAKQQLEQIISSPSYARMPDPYKAKLLDSVYKKYRNAANQQINAMIRRRTTVGD